MSPNSRHKVPFQCWVSLLPAEPCPASSQASTTLVPGVSVPIPIPVSTWDDGSTKLCPEAKAEGKGYQQPHDGTGAAVTSSSDACLFCRLRGGGTLDQDLPLRGLAFHRWRGILSGHRLKGRGAGLLAPHCHLITGCCGGEGTRGAEGGTWGAPDVSTRHFLER